MTLRIHLSIIQPPGYVHSQGFLDQARYARYQFRRLGATVTIGKNRLREDAVNLIFGGHLGFSDSAKDRFTCVFMNLEQLGAGGARVSNEYVKLLQTSAVVDYDQGNLAAYGCKVGDVPIISFGYAPYLAGHNALPLEERPIDLLFFGSINDRRRAIFKRIEDCGVNISRFDHPLYGEERDHFIRESKAVFNCHFYESSRFEQARVFHALSLGTPVISERAAHTSPPSAFESALTWVNDKNLELFFKNEFLTNEWLQRAHQQVASFASSDPSKSWKLAHAYCQSVFEMEKVKKAEVVWQPTRMNLGSGKDYKHGWLNIDVVERTEPDWLLDLSQPVTFPLIGRTFGGGHVRISENSLSEIYANNVLEHVPDLPRLMTNLLALLREGGALEVEVPYEKAITAWQDPTHLRAMNRNSWIYYTDWFWYLGWFNYRFEISDFSWLDTQLQVCPESQAAFMRLKLTKIQTSPKERSAARTMLADFGGINDDDWSDR